MNVRTLIALAAATALGCGGKGGSSLTVPLPMGIPPITDPIIVNTPDWFEITAVGAEMNGVKEYAWTCTKSQARLDLDSSTLFGSGSFRLEIYDAFGMLVHDNTYTTGLLEGGVRAVTRPGGTPGVWVLHFTFFDFHLDGTLELVDDGSMFLDEIRIGSGYFQSSGDLTYHVSWPAGPTTLHLGWTMDSGSVRIQIWDGLDALVFDRTYSAPLPAGMDTFPDTAPGASGVWTLKISLTNVVDGLSIEAPY